MKTADLMDVFQEELQSCEVQFRNLGGRKVFLGPCETLRCRNDNVLLKGILETQGAGRVLVVDGGGSLASALIGDVIAEIGRRKDWAGIVIYGAVRDTVAIAKLDFGVKALGSNPRRSEKKGRGQAGVEIEFGGVRIKPGDWIYCDEDGMVVANREIPLSQVQEAPH